MEEIIQWLTENINAEKISIAVQFVMSGGVLTWLATLVNRFKTTVVKTPDEIAKAVDTQIKQTLQKTQTDTLKALEEKIESLKSSNKILAESIVLLQSEDPNARLALIENVAKIDNVNQTVIEDAKTEVIEEIKAEEEKEEKVEELIEELEKPTL